MFPRAGIRFISVNDNYDSAHTDSSTSNIIVPFKNMVNDTYSLDISVKVRSQLDLKRKRGDFIGSFAVFGYCKDPDNRNRLVVDDYAADVVRDIYRWKVEGMSQQKIAERLNDNGILSPMEYKRALGMRFATSFKVNHKALWSAVAVGRILKNEIYTGVLEQGKRITPNYKVVHRKEIPKKDWIRVENAHAAIIDREMFETVQTLLNRDTHVAAGKNTVYALSGLIVCSDCGYNMIRKTVTSGKRKYHYYTCAQNREDKESCTTHLIRVDSCEQAVFHSIRAQIAAVLDLEQMVKRLEALPYQKENVRKLKAQIDQNRKEINRCKDLKQLLYEDFKLGVVSKEDFQTYKSRYDAVIKDAEAAIQRQEQEMDALVVGNTGNCEWIETFKAHQNITALDRKTVVELIDSIRVFKDKRIEVVFRYQNEFEHLAALLKYREAV